MKVRRSGLCMGALAVLHSGISESGDTRAPARADESQLHEPEHHLLRESGRRPERAEQLRWGDREL